MDPEELQDQMNEEQDEQINEDEEDDNQQ